MSQKFTPLIIIGAPRSGTNMLRDVLDALPGFDTWPCDEIPLIWRHGNLRAINDELPASAAKPSIKRYIWSQFCKEASRHKCDVLIEKTCANSLRVAFTKAVVPQAKYIYIVRDGRDVVASAHKRWTSGFELGYTLAKIRYMPWSDVPYHGFQFAWNRFYRLFSKQKRIAVWGPRFRGLEEALKTKSLDEVCGLQWQACVEASDRDFAGMDPTEVYRLRYEDFVENPGRHVREIAAFLGQLVSEQDIDSAIKPVKKSSVGKGRNEIDAETMERVEVLLKPTLLRHGYVDELQSV
ncbi:MAG: sulfotransferase family protein [Fimbriimonadaceae bacterium]